MSPNILNRYLSNSSHVWKASTSFSGTSAYNFLNIIDNTTTTPTNPALFTRIVISNVVAAGGTALFVRLVDTAGTAIATASYWMGYFGIDAGNGVRANGGSATSVYNIGDIGTTNSCWTLDFMHLTGTGTQMNGYGATNGGGTAATWPATCMTGGWNNYTALPISGIQLVSFGGINFSGKLNAYQQRRIV